MNSYTKGARLEYAVVNQYKNKGCIAFRSAGSHSPFDVVAIMPNVMKIVLIQCKNSKLSDYALKKEASKLKELGMHSTENTTLYLAYKNTRGEILYHYID
jgi:Holliday junction resolvase